MNKYITLNMIRDYGEVAKAHPATDEPVITELHDRWKGGSEAKANRWLGFMQGALYARGVFTLDQLKSHSRRHCVLDGIGGLVFPSKSPGVHLAQFPPLECATRGNNAADACTQAIALVRQLLGDEGLSLNCDEMAEGVHGITFVRIWSPSMGADALLQRVHERQLGKDGWETEVTKKRARPDIKREHVMDHAISIADSYTYKVDWSEAEGLHIGLCEEHPGLACKQDTIAAARFGIFEIVTQVVHDQLLAGEPPADPILKKVPR